jgi:3',5'-cyclic AMP phosphodiesterase CpdA
MPCYLAPGNHDVGNKPTLQTLNRYRDTFGDDYFSFQHKGYTFIINDTSLWKEPLADETQKFDVWFQNTLKNAHDANSPVFIVQHFLMYEKNIDEPNNYYNLPVTKRKEILSLLENNGVVALLGGHRHKTIINDYNGIQMVYCESTSRNDDKRPFGFRIWQVSPKSITHEFIPSK